MIALAAGVFLASVLGSLHCVGMCGGFVVMLFGGARPEDRRPVAVGYHGGRLISYTTLGLAAGGLGSLVDLGGSLAGVQALAMPLAAGSVVVFPAVTLLRMSGVRVARVRLPAAWTRGVRALQGAAVKLPPGRRALALGLLTTLLPCGWLYAFAVTAAGTGHPLAGGALMAVFWLGTVPLLAAAGLGVQKLAGPLAARVPGIACVLLLGVGLATLATRVPLNAESLAAAVQGVAGVNATPPDPAGTPACCALGSHTGGHAPAAGGVE